MSHLFLLTCSNFKEKFKSAWDELVVFKNCALVFDVNKYTLKARPHFHLQFCVALILWPPLSFLWTKAFNCSCSKGVLEPLETSPLKTWNSNWRIWFKRNANKLLSRETGSDYTFTRLEYIFQLKNFALTVRKLGVIVAFLQSFLVVRDVKTKLSGKTKYFGNFFLNLPKSFSFKEVGLIAHRLQKTNLWWFSY